MTDVPEDELAARRVRTMCPMNCHPTLCGMLVEVQGDRLLRVRGDPNNPDSRGFLCVRGQASREVIGNPQRLQHPLIREPGQPRGSGQLRPASWAEALDRIATAMGTVGREQVGIWAGHGVAVNSYGSRIHHSLLARFANLYGCQNFSGAMICWGLGGFGLGITGALEVHTKEDMSAHANLIVLWGANVASQPNTSRHIALARRRGARVITIDVRDTEAAALSDEVVHVRPGSDAALALAMLHVLVAEGLIERDFIAAHTVGYDAFAAHVRAFDPAWASAITGVPAARIAELARSYAAARPAMILVGGSSLHKGDNAWHAARAIACLPALTGNYGRPGGGLGPRHGGQCHGAGLGDISASERRPPGKYLDNQMPQITRALNDGDLRVLLLPGTNMLSSFADSESVAAGLTRAELVVTYDLFMNETSRRCADVVLPATSWLEELGCKITNTHVYLMERALDAPAQAQPLAFVLRELAGRLGVSDFWPWASTEAMIDALLDHPSTGQITVAELRRRDGIAPLQISHVAHPTHSYNTPSGKIELFSARAQALGLPPLPVHAPPSDRRAEPPNQGDYPLTLCQGRTLRHFHAFYDHGAALPSLAALDPEPVLWLSPVDAAARGIDDAAPIRIFNQRGELQARAHVTERIPAAVVWMRDGFAGLNRLTSGEPVLPDAACSLFRFGAGQARFEARVEVERA